MSVATPAQRGVVTFARQVAYNCHTRAVIERMAKTSVAAVAHQDHALLAALFGDGRYTRMAAQSTIISFSKSRARLRDHNGRYDSADSRQGAYDRNIAVFRRLVIVL